MHIPIKKILQIVAERHTNSPRISSKSIRLDMYVEFAEALRKKGMSEAEIEELTGVSEKKETLK